MWMGLGIDCARSCVLHLAGSLAIESVVDCRVRRVRGEGDGEWLAVEAVRMAEHDLADQPFVGPLVLRSGVAAVKNRHSPVSG